MKNQHKHMKNKYNLEFCQSLFNFFECNFSTKCKQEENNTGINNKNC